MNEIAYRASEIREWKDGSLPVFSYAGPLHDENTDDDNLLGYNATGQIVWPVMVVRGRGNTPSSTESTASLATATATGTGAISSTTGSVSSASSLSSSTRSTVSPVSTAGSENDKNSKKRQTNGGDDGSSSSGNGGSRSSQGQAQAVAKLSCLAVREAEEGSVLPGTPLRETNAVSPGRLASVTAHLHVLIAVWGLVAGYMALL